jgi:hypothetical protein
MKAKNGEEEEKAAAAGMAAKSGRNRIRIMAKNEK